MPKKLITICAAVAALSIFAVAPAASASPVLTNEGAAVPVGTEIKGNNTGTFAFNEGSYTISCGTVDLTATVAGNAGSQIKLETAPAALTSSGTATAGDCTASWGPATLTWGRLCFETTSGTDNVKVTGCGANITMTTNITGVVICKYAAASVTASFLTNADATFSLSAINLTKTEGSGLFCPSQITFSLDLDLTTASGKTLSIS